MSEEEFAFNELQSIIVSQLIVELCPSTPLLASNIDKVKDLAERIADIKIDGMSLTKARKDEEKERHRVWTEALIRNLKRILHDKGRLIE